MNDIEIRLTIVVWLWAASLVFIFIWLIAEIWNFLYAPTEKRNSDRK